MISNMSTQHYTAKEAIKETMRVIYSVHSVVIDDIFAQISHAIEKGNSFINLPSKYISPDVRRYFEEYGYVIDTSNIPYNSFIKW